MIMYKRVLAKLKYDNVRDEWTLMDDPLVTGLVAQEVPKSAKSSARSNSSLNSSNIQRFVKQPKHSDETYFKRKFTDFPNHATMNTWKTQHTIS